jgi:XTP/dITP diphosphohydrolase
MLIYFATSNVSKVSNARAALGKFGIEVEQVALDLVDSRAEDPTEIAREKAVQAFRTLNKPVMVEDSGFFIRALGGFPMTHIKFSLKTLGVKNILKMLKGVRDRQAEWRMTVAYAFGPDDSRTFTFVEKGTVATALRPVKRQMMSDYWRVYIPKMLKSNRLALCEMTDAALNNWQEYYATHNQFMMLGKWLSGRRRKKD